jgi:hypothetical protein
LSRVIVRAWLCLGMFSGRDASGIALSSQWMSAAPDVAAVKAGRRPPPEAARSGLDGGEDGATLADRDVSMRAASSLT